MARRAGVVLWAVWALVACDDEGGAVVDVGPPDAAAVDVGAPDAMGADAVVADAAAPPDAAPPDAAGLDAAPPDAAPLDAAPPDAMAPDAAPPDPPCVDGACPDGLRCVADACVPVCLPDGFEPNEGPLAATPIAVGEAVDGSLCAGDADWLAFEVGAGPVVVDVAFRHARGDLDVQVFDARGRLVGDADSVTDDERVELEAPAPGRYFLRIYGYEQAENTWRVRVDAAPGVAPACPPDADEENDGPEAAAPRAPGRYEGATTCDEDWYRLEACPGRRVTAWARFDHRFGDIDVELYDDRGIRQVRSASTTDDEGVAFRAGRDAPLFLRVFGYGGAINGYDLEISHEGECEVCGDGVVGFPEACDGDDLAGEDCRSLGFDAGALACGADCRRDASGCRYSRCGDGVVEGDEACDGAGDATCAGLGMAGGALGCTADCVWDSSGCEGGQALSGVVTYERPRPVCNPFVEGDPCAEDDCCLRPGDAEVHPVRGARVEIRAADGEAVLATTFTDDEGRYAARWAGEAQVRVAVWAETARPRARVVDNTDGASLYGVLSPFPPEPPLDAAVAGTHDVHLSAGWGPNGFDGPRPASPFALLDTVRTASEAVLAARPALPLVPLTLNWSVLNDRCTGDDAAGCIGTSHWDGQLWILGKADVDTDEFDAHVVAHEWTHAFEATVGRADSIGGSHSSGQLKDPRLAFGEGLASGVAAMVLAPDPVYIDTTGVGASRGFFQDMQDNGRDRNPGWFSEATVRTLLFDLFDDDDEPGDGVALGLGGVLDALLSPEHLETPAFSTLFSLVNAAKAQGDGAAIDALVTTLLAAPPCEVGEGLCGLDPVQDAWGTGETHGGGLPLPVYTPLDVDAPVDVPLRHGGEPDTGPTNWLSSSRFLRFDAGATPRRVRADCPADRDVDLFVYRQGRGVGVRQRDFHRAEPGDQWIDVPAEPGPPLVVVLRADNDDAQPFTCRVTLEALP